MIDFIKDLLINYGVNEGLSLIISKIIAAGIVLIIYIIVDKITKKFFLKVLRAYITKSESKWDDILLKNKVFNTIARIPPALVIHAFAPIFTTYQVWIQRIVFCYIVINVVLIINKLLDSVDDIYRNYPISRTRPIKGYIQVRYNKEHNINTSSIVNGRHLTNIGTFRAYIESYLKNHPKINKRVVHMARQLQPTDKGIPIEIYAFTDGTAWLDYESIQSDIFDYILAIIPEFDLKVYQNPTGNDLKNIQVK